MQNINISVLILTYQGDQIIQKCIEGALNQKYIGDMEILVLDNGSTDNTFSILKANTNIKLFKNKVNRSFTSGFNKLFKESKGDYILILSNDVFLSGEDFFKKLIPLLDSNNLNGAIAPMSIKPDNSLEQIPKKEISLLSLFIDYTILGPILNILPNKLYSGRQNYNLEEDIFDVDVLQDSCLLVKRSALDENRIFDEKMKFYYTEDYLGDSIRSKKLKLIYNTDVKVNHLYRHGTSKMGKLRIAWLYLVDALAYSSQKYNPYLTYLGLAPLAFITLFLRILYWLVRGELTWKS